MFLVRIIFTDDVDALTVYRSHAEFRDFGWDYCALDFLDRIQAYAALSKFSA